MTSPPRPPTGRVLDVAELRRQVAEHEWYHTMELAPGVVTPGWFDHRPVLDRIPLPATLDGRRCLDVGTFDGFFAFEMERRGAREVVAIDILDPQQWDWPANTTPETIAALARRKAEGRGFALAHAALRSAVERLELSVYDLDPVAHGEFDLVYVGSLLLHLRDPVGALARVRAVCRGDLVLVDNVDWTLTRLFPRRPIAGLDGRGRPWWWKPNASGLVRMLEAAGFAVAEQPRLLFLPPGPGQPRPRPQWRWLRSLDGIENAVTALRGDPHLAVVAR